MYKFLIKYDFLFIIPFEETYFYTTLLPKKVKFSREILKLNYLKFSPYQETYITHILQKNLLYLWFYEKKRTQKILIPESYLAYKILKEKNENTLYIINDKPLKVLIIDNGKLVSTFTMDTYSELTITLSMEEFQISHKVEISQEEYSALITQSLQSLKIKELIAFNQLTLDKKTLLNNIIENFTYPFVTLVLLSMIVSYTQTLYLKTQIDELKSVYKEKKELNKDKKQALKKHNKEIKKYKKFIKKELQFIGPITLMDALYTVFKNDDTAYLTLFRLRENILEIRIQTNMNPILFLNRLNTLKYFKSVVIKNTYKPRNSMKIVTYEIEVKKIEEL